MAKHAVIVDGAEPQNQALVALHEHPFALWHDDFLVRLVGRKAAICVLW